MWSRSATFAQRRAARLPIALCARLHTSPASSSVGLGESLGGTLVVSDSSWRDTVQRAAKEGTLSFGFSAGGCLFPYYIGVAGSLSDAGLLTDKVKLGGASAGSLLAAAVKSGMSYDRITEWTLELMADCRQAGTRGRLGDALVAALERGLPDDAHERIRDRAFIAVTRAFPFVQPLLVSEFSSKADLIEGLLASCHIPYWLDGRLTIPFRGAAAMDGGITNFIPIPPDTVGVRICCFPSRQLSPIYRIGISPDSFEDWPYSLVSMVRWALEPADEETVTLLMDKGRSDALAWMDSMGLAKEERAAQQKAESGSVAAAKEAARQSPDAPPKGDQAASSK